MYRGAATVQICLPAYAGTVRCTGSWERYQISLMCPPCKVGGERCNSTPFGRDAQNRGSRATPQHVTAVHATRQKLNEPL